MQTSNVASPCLCRQAHGLLHNDPLMASCPPAPLRPPARPPSRPPPAPPPSPRPPVEVLDRSVQRDAGGGVRAAGREEGRELAICPLSTSGAAPQAPPCSSTSPRACRPLQERKTSSSNAAWSGVRAMFRGREAALLESPELRDGQSDDDVRRALGVVGPQNPNAGKCDRSSARRAEPALSSSALSSTS